MTIRRISIVLLITMTAASLAALPAGAAGSSAVSEAGADTLRHYTMDEIVVTAKRIGFPLEDLALSVSILGPEEIGTTLKNSSTDLAGLLPGVFIMKTGDFGRSDVNIRGLGSNGRRAMVLLDGRPERMALFDCTVTHSFPLHDVERVEVVKGPSSMLYGSGAMGGVMNVIPRRPRTGLELELDGSAGSWETYVTSGRLAGSQGRISGSISADYRESAGHIEHSAYSGTDVTARGEAVLREGMSLSAAARLFDGYKEEPLRATDDPASVTDTWNDYRRGSVDLHLRGGGEKGDYGVRYYRSFGEHEFSDGFHSKDVTDGVSAYASRSLLDGLEISGGADYRSLRGRLPDTPGAEWDRQEGGVFAEVEYLPWEVLAFSAGARYNYDGVYGEQVSPSFGMVWHPLAGTTLRAAASHGFRSPAISELYMYPSSNEDLEAESAWSYEAGLRQRLPAGLALDLSAYRMDGKNMIVLADNPAPPPLLRFSNSADFVFDGLEASLEGRWSNGLGGSVSYSYLDPGQLTQGRPGSMFGFDLHARRGRFTAKLTGTSVADYFGGNDSTDRIPSYTVVDLYAEGRVLEGVSAFLGIGNIGGEEYFVFTDLPGGAAGLYLMPGRSFTGGLKLAM